MSHRCPTAVCASFNHRQHIAGGYSVTGFHFDRHHHTRPWRPHLVLHLHRFHYHHARALLNLRARFRVYAHDLAGHRREDLRHAVMMSIRVLTAAQTLRIDDRHRMTAPVKRDVESIICTGMLTDATLVHVRVQKEEITACFELTHLKRVNP